jgi:hypothetical protein
MPGREGRRGRVPLFFFDLLISFRATFNIFQGMLEITGHVHTGYNPIRMCHDESWQQKVCCGDRGGKAKRRECREKGGRREKGVQGEGRTKGEKEGRRERDGREGREREGRREGEED